MGATLMAFWLPRPLAADESRHQRHRRRGQPPPAPSAGQRHQHGQQQEKREQEERAARALGYPLVVHVGEEDEEESLLEGFVDLTGASPSPSRTD